MTYAGAGLGLSKKKNWSHPLRLSSWLLYNIDVSARSACKQVNDLQQITLTRRVAIKGPLQEWQERYNHGTQD
jgi:hypothetical protein